MHQTLGTATGSAFISWLNIKLLAESAFDEAVILRDRQRGAHGR